MFFACSLFFALALYADNWCGRSVRNALGDVGYKCELEVILLQSFAMSKTRAR